MMPTAGASDAEPFDLEAFRAQYADILEGRERAPVPGEPIVIAHRGASGYVPEHTLTAYTLAVLMGADYIEPDLVMTRDGHLIARHDNLLHLTTDVAQIAAFADRETRREVDGVVEAGWFSEDFTLAEIKRLNAIERIPEIRPDNTRFDHHFKVPTLEEIIQRVRQLEAALDRKIGLYPETKHPTHFADRGLAMEKPLVEILHAHGYRGPDAPVYIQSFEVSNLQALDELTDLPLIQLLWVSGGPYDAEKAGKRLTYDQMASPEGLKKIARYADGVGPEKYHFILPERADGSLHIEDATDFITQAHAAGLKVHPYTFRAENFFLPTNFQSQGPSHQRGDMVGELSLFLELGIDGFFTDQADLGVEAKARFQ